MKKQYIPAIIFYGSIWGIIEASIGYLLHALPISIYISGTILFPIVSFLLYKAYKATNSKQALLAIGVIAASIKAVDFLMPFGSPFKIINPMISIILESFMVFMVINVLDKDNVQSKVKALAIASIGWRLMYVAYNGIQYLMNGYVSNYIASVSAFVQFTLIFGGISLAIGLAFIYLDQLLFKTDARKLMSKLNPLVSLVTLAMALFITIIA